MQDPKSTTDEIRARFDADVERIEAVSPATLNVMQSDIRTAELGISRYDIILAAMVLHHLRGVDEWKSVFRNL